ncbi:MAG: DUF5060 domain-containing protein [candidate division KSB1 bacterium]|nr:DUF5060 domain-containing protein [candidate division KSB1 bacterium]
MTLAVLFLLNLAAGFEVPQWGIFEQVIETTAAFADPFRDASLEVEFTRPDGSKLAFWGFYTGGNRWAFRCMPDRLGEWRWEARFSDGSLRQGTFTCVESDLPGLISRYEPNPIWFGFRNGRAVLLRSLHVGDCFFADAPNALDPTKVWNDSLRTRFLDWAQQQGYNMLSIGSFFLNRREKDRGLGWNTPRLWDSQRQQPIPAEYERLEAVLNDLSARKIVVYPFAGFFGKRGEWPADSTARLLYLKYTLARLAPYWNLLFLVAGPEPLHPETGDAYQNAMAEADIKTWGGLIARLDPYRHLLSVHNRTEASDEGDPFKEESWYTYSTIQGPKTLDRRLLAQKTLMNHHPQKPYYAQETLWAGNIWHPDYGLEDLRKNAIVLNLCAATINFADNAGTSSTGFSGLPRLEDRVQEKHDILKRVWDFIASLPFYDMKPAPERVSDGFCLAKGDSLLLIYLDRPMTTRLLGARGRYRLEWIDGRDTSRRIDAGTIDATVPLVPPADGDDWFARLVKIE